DCSDHPSKESATALQRGRTVSTQSRLGQVDSACRCDAIRIAVRFANTGLLRCPARLFAELQRETFLPSRCQVVVSGHPGIAASIFATLLFVPPALHLQ